MRQTNDYYLPRCVAKKELKNYFDVSYDELWRKILTVDLLEKWGFEVDEIKKLRLLPPKLTKSIYLHYEIKDLNMTMHEELYGVAET